jgi:predicted phage terminase large subunit-like protein
MGDMNTNRHAIRPASTAKNTFMGVCAIGVATTKYTTANKETKILVNAPWIKEHCLFKDKSVLDGQKEYKTFLRFLTGYTMMGKNAHDDVPDAMAMLSEYAQGLSVASAERITNPFSRFRR